jgi:ApbE superfamily uncharacterized protein (UPF0280 family)
VTAAGLVTFTLAVRESGLQVSAGRDLTEEATNSLLRHRRGLEEVIRRTPAFRDSLDPVEPIPAAPKVVRLMIEAGRAAGVGPMAAVAGAIARCVGEDLLAHSATVVVENGGDIWMQSFEERVVGIYAGAGTGAFSFGLRIPAGSGPIGICTSSGVIGPSFSAGAARGATVIAGDAALADAAATGLGNRVRRADDVDGALRWAAGVPGLRGAAVVIGETFGVWGSVDLVPLSP